MERSGTATDSGEGVVGYVILVPVALFLVMLGIQAAVYFHAANIAQQAGARAVAVASRHGAGAAAGEREAQIVVRDSGSTLVAASVSDGELVWATVTVRVDRVVPFFPAAVTRHAGAPKERFVPEDER
jgi:hypothetical protein